jgi:uncharacterized protein YprB with RNaseH-like and TPR domain
MGATDELRRRLEALNRGPLKASGEAASAAAEQLRRELRKRRRRSEAAGADAPPGGCAREPPQRRAAEPIVYPRDLPRSALPAVPPVSAGPFVSLEDALGDSGALAADGSGVYVVERRADGDEGRRLAEALRSAVASRDSGLRAQLRHIGFEGPLDAGEVVLFDLETTGLSCCPLFLAGTMAWRGGVLVSRQYFARDYSQEAGVVRLFQEAAAGGKLLVSFNGKTFDAPFLRARAAANGVAFRLDHAHLDLLHAARRIWKGALPDCRLQTLERHICGRLRAGDIPGHLIPDAYHAFVHTGNATQMVSVLEHNYLDLVTMADLMVRLPRWRSR